MPTPRDRARKRKTASYIGAGVVPAAGPVNTEPPEITGTAQVGETLTVTPGTWTGEPTVTYQWHADAEPIEDAVDDTYEPVEDDIGAVITVTETATNSRGSASATSEPTAAVIAAD